MRRIPALLALLWLASPAFGQATTTTFPLPTINGVRDTYRPEHVNLAPVFDTLPATATFTQNQAGSFDLAQYCEDDDPVTFTKQSGTYPTGLSLVGSLVTGTPTTVQTQAISFRCDDGDLHDDASINLAIEAVPTPDTTPDVFVFAPQSPVTRNATVTAVAVTISGINAAATTTVSGGTWSKNGGSFVSSAGTVIAGDTVQVRHTSSVNYSTQTQTTLTVGGVAVVFTSITEENPNRVGVIYTASAASLPANSNPIQDDWPVARDGAVDGLQVKHLGDPEWGAPSNVRALSHLQIIGGTTSVGSSNTVASCDGDGKYFKGSLYPSGYSPSVSYGPVNGGGAFDKPRINMPNTSAATKLHDAGASDFHYRKDHWVAICVFLPANYVEDTKDARETFVQFGNDGENSLDCAIRGSASGASWKCEMQRFPLGGGAETLVKTVSSAVTEAQKGTWTVHIWNLNFDNRTSGGSPKMKWWICTNITSCALVSNDTTTAYGQDEAGDPDGWNMQLNLFYKPGWHGYPSAYTGNKSSAFSMAMDGVRVGSSSSSFQDVHPTRQAQP